VKGRHYDSDSKEVREFMREALEDGDDLGYEGEGYDHPDVQGRVDSMPGDELEPETGRERQRLVLPHIRIQTTARILDLRRL
jgi:hypothetical protein